LAQVETNVCGGLNFPLKLPVAFSSRFRCCKTNYSISQWGRFINKKRGEKTTNWGERQKNSENQVTLDSIFGTSKKHYLSNFVLYML
jgi:hypothetical protein